MSSSSKSKKPAPANFAAKKPAPQQQKAPAKPAAKPQPKGVPFKPAAQQSGPAAKPAPKATPFKAVQPSKPAVKSAAKPAPANFAAKKPAPQQQKAPAKPAAKPAAKPQPKGVPFKPAAQQPGPAVKPAAKPAPANFAAKKPAPQQQKASAKPAAKPAAKPQPKGVPFKPAAKQQHTPKEQPASVQNQNKPKSAVATAPGKATMTSDKNLNRPQAAPVKQQVPAPQAKTAVTPSGAHQHPAAEFSSETLAVLFKAAKKASEHAYAPYSRFKVGAILLLEDGQGDASQISAYTGCNVENASYGLTCCAERIAVFKAISDGNKKFKAMILYAAAKKPVSPCGACRQVLAEFAPADMKIYSIGQFRDEDVSKTPYAIYTVSELLPHGFKASDFIEKK